MKLTEKQATANHFSFQTASDQDNMKHSDAQ